MKRPLTWVLVGFAISSAAGAATTLWTKLGEHYESFLGYGACGGLDYNGDGVNDVLAAADYDAGRNASAGKVYVWSGAGQSLLFSAVGEARGTAMGSSGGPAGRVNGDAFEDFVVGAQGFQNGYGKLDVYAGGSGALIFTKAGKSLGLTNVSGFGRVVSRTPGDWNGDGRADIAAAASQHSKGNGRVYVWSGANASQLLLVNGTGAGNFGGSIAFADVNDDGFSDLIVGEAQYAGGTGRVHVLMGPTGAAAAYSPIVGQGGAFGWLVSSLGDFTGDGIDDFAVSAPSYNGGLFSQGRAYVYSGDGSLVGTLTGSVASQSLGIYLSGAGDFNNDGLGDLAVLLAGQGPRRLQVFPGPDLGSGVPLITYTQPTISYGNNFCSAGDTNGDSFDELVIGSPADATSYPFAGKIYVESFVP